MPIASGTARKRYRYLGYILALAAVFAVGTAGYVVLEGYSLLDAVFMTAISVTTVGYGEPHPLSPLGKVFTVFLLLFGIGTVGYLVGHVVEDLVEAGVRRAPGRRRMENAMKHLSGHQVLCGCGRLGWLVAQRLAAEGVPFVVVERDPAVADQAEAQGWLVLRGDASHDEVLLKAGVRRATGLVSLMSDDADNVFVTMEARDLNPDIQIIARYIDPKNRQRMERAGANRTVSPVQIGADRFAQLVTMPNVVDLLDLAGGMAGIALQLQELRVPAASTVAGRSLAEADVRRRHGIMVIGVRRPGGTMLFNPDPQLQIAEGDTLVALGEPGKLAAFRASTRVEAERPAGEGEAAAQAPSTGPGPASES